MKLNQVLSKGLTLISAQFKFLTLLISLSSLIFSFGCMPEPQESEGTLSVYPWKQVSKDFPHVLTLGIVPQQAPSALERRWAPLVEYLEKELDLTIYLKTASSIPTFEARCREGRYDLAYMNPYHYVAFSEATGYRAFARQKDKRIKGIMVMRKDREDQSLASLDQSKLAFPSPAAFAASLLTRAHLKSINVAFEPVYVRSHDSVYKAVAEGLYPSGGGVKRTFASTDPKVREQLKIAWTTKAFTPHALASHPRVPQFIINKIQVALAKLDAKTKFPHILKPINFNGFIKAQHEDWDDVKALGLTELARKK